MRLDQHSDFRPQSATRLPAVAAPGGQDRKRRGEPHPPAAQYSQLAWVRENAQALHRLFLRVERRRAEGLTLNQALRRRPYRARYRTARRIRVRHSTSHLRILYYRWRRAGRSPESLLLRLGSGLPPVAPETVRDFVSACGAMGVRHFSRAIRLTNADRLHYRRILSALPDDAVRVIQDTFSARRRAESEARQQVSVLQRQMRRALVADAAMARRLRRLSQRVYGASGLGGVSDPSAAEKGACSTNWYNLQGGPARSLR
jgi:hypothetical protein